MAGFCQRQYHPYAQGLLAAVPVPDPRQKQILHDPQKTAASVAQPPEGCPYYPLCPHPEDRCAHVRPELVEVAPEHFVACWATPRPPSV